MAEPKPIIIVPCPYCGADVPIVVGAPGATVRVGCDSCARPVVIIMPPPRDSPIWPGIGTSLETTGRRDPG